MKADAIFKRYPYFLFPQAEALEENLDPEERARLVKRVGALLPDEDALRRLAGVTPEEFNTFYPDQSAADLSTEETIASFLEHFGGKQSTAMPEADAAGLVPVMPAVDYASMLERLEEEADAPMPTPDTADSTSSAIDSFLGSISEKTEDSLSQTEEKGETVHCAYPKSPEAERKRQKKIRELGEVAVEMEEVRSLIKTHHYDVALYMLERIKLRDPAATPFLDDQIRFLRRLITLKSS